MKPGPSTLSTTESAVERDAVMRTLSKPGRRSVLKQVCDYDGSIDASDLATTLATTDSETAWAGDREQARRSLRHIHLPKLAEAGLIEYDRATETAVATETGRRTLASLSPAR